MKMAQWLRTLPATDDCVPWPFHKDRDGYGRAERGHLAHRRSYTLHVGPIPAGLTIDHLCGTRSCVNPRHLEPVTTQENTRRGYWTQRTECRNGHPFTPKNTRHEMRADGVRRRVCRICERRAAAAYQARKAA